MSKLRLSNNINESAAYADYLIFVIPSAFLYKELELLTTDIKNKVIFSAIKGIVHDRAIIRLPPVCEFRLFFADSYFLVTWMRPPNAQSPHG